MTGFSPQTLHALGWTLLHFIWQGAVLAALLAASLTLSRNANVRYVLGIVTLILMMAAPVSTFVWLDRAAAPPVRLEIPVVANVGDAIAPDHAVPASGRLVHALAAGANRPDMMLGLVEAWFVGVMLLSARMAGGLLWLARTRRGDIEPLSDEVYRQCLALQRRMGLKRRIHYGQCHWLDAPAVLGWLQPIVLVTTQALTGLSAQQLQAIIAHELAHIRRFDAFVNLFQIAAEMLLFYHPAVWWVNRRIRIEREVCCDQEALIACGEPVSYARALALMEEWRAAPSLLMAANRGPLTERVLRLLGLQGTSTRTRIAGIGVSIVCITAALFAGYVFVSAAQAAPDTQPSSATNFHTIEKLPAPAAPPSRTASRPPSAPHAQEAPPPKQAPSAPAPPEVIGQLDGARQKKSSYVERLAAAGFDNLTADELIAMKVQGITPAYIEAVLALQLHPRVEELIAMKVHDVTPEYVDQARRQVPDPDIEEIIAMKVHDITPQFMSELQAAGLDIHLADDFIAARTQGITPEFIKSATDRGFRNLTLEKLIMLRHADVL